MSLDWVLSPVPISDNTPELVSQELGAFDDFAEIAAIVCSIGRCDGRCRGEMVNWKSKLK